MRFQKRGEHSVHIVVEHRVLVPVLVEQPLRVRHAEVLEVQEAVRVVLADQLDESVCRAVSASQRR